MVALVNTLVLSEHLIWPLDQVDAMNRSQGDGKKNLNQAETDLPIEKGSIVRSYADHVSTIVDVQAQGDDFDECNDWANDQGA